MEIRIENITKRYGSQKAVDNVSFSVNTGEIVGFLGPNGAGKTTTMKIITQYLAPDDGKVFIGGREAKGVDVNRHIGYLPELNPLYGEMGVVDYLVFCAKMHGLPSVDISSRIRAIVGETGLDAEKHKKISELSKGYRQRVGLAQALIHNPKILILDEPTTGLDPNQIVEIRELIKKLGREKTVILSTHILPEVEASCDRILIINNGKLIADGTAAALRSSASQGHSVKLRIVSGDPQKILVALNDLSSVHATDWHPSEERVFVVQSVDGLESNIDIFRLCAQNDWVITEMIPAQQRLEDIFRKLTLN